MLGLITQVGERPSPRKPGMSRLPNTDDILGGSGASGHEYSDLSARRLIVKTGIKCHFLSTQSLHLLNQEFAA